MGLIQKKAKAVAKNAFGRPLSEYGKTDASGATVKSVNYEYAWFEYEDNDSLVAAKDELTLDEQRKVRNTERKTKERQAANAAAIKAIGIEAPNAETDSQVRLKAVYTGFYGKYLAQGMTADDAKAAARTKASEILEEAWDDEDED